MRSLWKGSISFGLVNIPVEMFSISQTQDIKFNLLHEKDHSEIRYARICKSENKEVPWNEIVKGFNENGKYIIFTDDDLKKASAEKSPTLDIMHFCDLAEIDPIYYEKPYVITPQKNSHKAYTLLIEILKKSKKVGIARFVLHNREHVAVLRPFDKFIMLNQLRFKSELAALGSMEAPTSAKVSAPEIEIGIKLIHHMEQSFKAEQFHDNYSDEVKKILKQKVKGEKLVAPPKAAAKPSKIVDIMSLLKASLDEEEVKHKKKKRA